MQYAILRHAKIKAPLMGAAVAHNHRTSSVEKCNIDATRTPLNLVLKGEGTAAGRLANKLKGLATKVRKDAVVAVELVLSASPEWFDELTKDRAALHQHPKFRAWANESMAWARREFGQNIIDVALHMDESSPHMHVLAVPLTKDGRLCAKEILARSELTRRQDSYAKALQGLGLSRGEPAKETKRRHIKLTEKASAEGGKASELAAQLAAATTKIEQQAKLIQRLQGFCTEYMKEQRELKDKLAMAEKGLEDAKRLAAFEKQVQAQMYAERMAALAVQQTSQNDPETAMAAFLDKNKALPWCDPQQAAVGTLVVSEGRFAVLHLGRGRHALFEFPSAQAVQELKRNRLSGPER